MIHISLKKLPHILGSTLVNQGGWQGQSSATRSRSRSILSQAGPVRKRVIAAIWAIFLLLFLWRISHLKQARGPATKEIFWWESLPRLNGFYHGRKTIVPFADYVPEQDGDGPVEVSWNTPGTAPFAPYSVASQETCYLDSKNLITPPKISAYQGIPQHMAVPAMGSYEEIGLNEKVCFDRVGRYGPYGLGYSEDEGGLGLSMGGDNEGIGGMEKIDYRGIRWAEAQNRCLDKNSHRGLPKTAFILRTWHDLKYTPHQILMLRAIISELSLGSGGEYEVHFLVHVRDESIPIWASREVYEDTLRASLPLEFQGMGTLWSIPQMQLIYPPPFPDSFENISGGNLYSAYRSLHFPLQYFASQHDFDFYWHWETDLRTTGHYYELLDRVTKWADRQPRAFLWERSARFYVPASYGNSYEAFGASVERDAASAGREPVSGPQSANLLAMANRPSSLQMNAEREITDLITFNPIFDPNNTAWAFKGDATGYNTSLPETPRRASLITATRLSRRLLELMHAETFRHKHTMFPEMFPASLALHYGLKAVHVPIPMYFDRGWSAEALEATFNAGPDGSSGGGIESPFGPREHVFRGSSYYSNGQFGGAVWRRWLGKRENGEGGPMEEVGEGGSGRMCLRSMILHPVKLE